jgi:hypothetical protein
MFYIKKGRGKFQFVVRVSQQIGGRAIRSHANTEDGFLLTRNLQRGDCLFPIVRIRTRHS